MASVIEDVYKNLNLQKIDNILDIGAGTGFKTKKIAEVVGCNEVWILEGFAENNVTKSNAAMKVKWRNTANDFNYYWPKEKLTYMLKEGMGKINWYLIDADNIDIPINKKFDIINSTLSCGYHYPLETYSSLIKAHSHQGTKLIFDLRIDKRGKLIEDKNFKIEKILHTVPGKCSKCLLTLTDL